MKQRLDRLGGVLVGIYFERERLPVLFLLYIAITAMTRFLAVDVRNSRYKTCSSSRHRSSS